jgi:cytochrome d ubiquinol oxidase subunit II
MAEALALVMLGALALYVLAGGADFGAGVWDLLASGPRAAAQRELIERAMAPIWEANHVWLILVVVLLFSGFPTAYAAATTALHVPLTIMLVGIVLRGSAFVFRHYSTHSDDVQWRWGRVFAVASTITPVFLGVSLGAVTAGALRVSDGAARVDGGYVAAFVRPWLGVFPFAVGLLTLSLFAFLAAAYSTVETNDVELRDDFRRRALAAEVAIAASAALGAATAPASAARFTEALHHSWWSWPLHALLLAVALAACALLWLRRFRVARVAAAAQAVVMVATWGAGQHPFLIAPDLTIADAAAPPRTLAMLLGALGAGAIVLLPSLWWLFRVFKSTRGTR